MRKAKWQKVERWPGMQHQHRKEISGHSLVADMAELSACELPLPLAASGFRKRSLFEAGPKSGSGLGRSWKRKGFGGRQWCANSRMRGKARHGTIAAERRPWPLWQDEEGVVLDEAAEQVLGLAEKVTVNTTPA